MSDFDYLDYDGMENDPKQLRVLKKLCAHLERTPGYDGIKVIRGKGTITSKEAEDTISLLEAPRALFENTAGWGGFRHAGDWSLLLQGWPKDDPNQPGDPAYILKAAVEKQLALVTSNDDAQGRERKDKLFNLGGDISKLEMGQGIVRPVSNDQGNSRLAEFFIPLLVGIQTDKLNPSK